MTWLRMVVVDTVYLSWYPSCLYFRLRGRDVANVCLVCSRVSLPEWLPAFAGSEPNDRTRMAGATAKLGRARSISCGVVATSPVSLRTSIWKRAGSGIVPPADQA